jgi:hypothetical protein
MMPSMFSKAAITNTLPAIQIIYTIYCKALVVKKPYSYITTAATETRIQNA